MSRPKAASPATRRLLLGLLAAYVFLLWALAVFIVVLEHGGFFLAPGSVLEGLLAVGATIVAARLHVRAWRDETALATAVLVSVGTAAAVLALSFGLTFGRALGGGETPSPAARTFRDPQCHTPVVATDAFTWACTTMTIQPWKVAAGGPVTLTYRFRAKRTLHYVKVCFPGLSTDKCLYAHRYPTIARGAVVKRVVHDVAGNESMTINYDVLNQTSFYKATPEVAAALREERKINPSASLSSMWWWVGAGHVCVIVSGSNAGCNWGRD